MHLTEKICKLNTVIGYRIDLYFCKYKFEFKVEELGQAGTFLNNKIERQEALERKLDCVFIRINPDEKHFNI